MNVIGHWVKKPGRRWHLTESVIAGAAITRCGRRLEHENSDITSDVEPLTRLIGQPQLCKWCSRVQPTWTST